MRKNGFTLIEMLVVGAIFALIMVAVLGVFVSAIQSQRYNLASQQLLDQASYSMEYMSRFIRMAKKELNDGTTNCLSADGLNYENTYGGSGLKFKNYRKECQEFFREWDATNGVYQLKVIEKIGTPDERKLALSSTKFNVKSLNFFISGQSQTDTIQPRVTIFLEMEGKGGPPQPKIKIQTTISQRDIDVEE